AGCSPARSAASPWGPASFRGWEARLTMPESPPRSQRRSPVPERPNTALLLALRALPRAAMVPWSGGPRGAAGPGGCETAMKFHIDIEGTPEEARVLLGMPDVRPIQEMMMKEMEDRMRKGLAAMD